MTVREFAATLGVSDRVVSKWEARGSGVHPRPVNQAALDTLLARSGDDVLARFATAVHDGAGQGVAHAMESTTPSLSQRHITHPVDGKSMTLVEAGMFFLGSDDEPTWLDAFYMDVYPTTNSDYFLFVAATGHRPPRHWVDGHPPEDTLDHPVVFVSWNDARRYAEWATKSLPSSRQWERAARGHSGDRYPWGDQSTAAKCNVRESRMGSTTPVNRYHSGVSLEGVYDLCGNTWEWCSTEAGPGRRELKGSAFTSPFSHALPSTFNDASVDMCDDDASFRCVVLPHSLPPHSSVEVQQ